LNTAFLQISLITDLHKQQDDSTNVKKIEPDVTIERNESSLVMFSIISGDSCKVTPENTHFFNVPEQNSSGIQTTYF
jgi:hypothetical protein